MRKLHRIKGFVRAYTVKGVRYSYGELAIKFPNRAKQIRDKTREIAKEMTVILVGKTVVQTIDNNKLIMIGFSSKNNKEFVRQAMLTLSGKYFTRKEMLGINRILSKAVYVPTSHLNKHKGEDDKTLWFTYKDSTRSGIWFKVKRDMSGGGRYYLYSLSDRI